MITSSSDRADVALPAANGGEGFSPYVPFAEYPDILKTAQAAQALQVDEKTVRELIKRGELYAVRVGRVIRVPKKSLIDFIGGE